ncbi:hypothetical protein CDHC01_0069 [Corynebacterium diphtheriae HC01]|mgnify:FL=1|uniref:hypothetical protein n=1 Tax=Corynebacterium TaxID=1716 RepID=UPI000245BC18|nr:MULTISPECIES: hypothetical protein [Corynebacterium]OFO12262.1 hypothetical protein HMPREF3088_07995 [Corynebacterium sp. HMSC22B11]OLN14644.1 hypothetical protein BUE64_11870 [Corynebacterium diphtheriae subsp. lausannense]TYR15008.1 hypothetical protein FYJ89_00050 [Corynebacterium urealyticum]CAB1023373.1 hypothetical protein FRC0522_02013 [Corynebacterium diphtheriae]AEX43137.1 hypothetical protein CD241_0070 [Corynebacterium diphtheriae 241]
MSRLSTLVNNDQITLEQVHSPVMATPAAFGAGVVAGAKACGALVAAAGVGAAIASATKK